MKIKIKDLGFDKSFYERDDMVWSAKSLYQFAKKKETIKAIRLEEMPEPDEDNSLD